MAELAVAGGLAAILLGSCTLVGPLPLDLVGDAGAASTSGRSSSGAASASGSTSTGGSSGASSSASSSTSSATTGPSSGGSSSGSSTTSATLVVLAPSPGSPGTGIAVDSRSVYWTDDGAGLVLGVPIGGGAVTTIASGLNEPWGIAVSAGWVYWTTFQGGTVGAALADGGSPRTIARSQVYAQDLVTDGVSLYWTVNNANDTPTGTVVAYSLDAGTLQTLASGQNQPCRIALHQNLLAWADYGGTVGLDILPLTENDVATAQLKPEGVAVDAAHVYWVDSAGGTVSQAQLDGSGQILLVQSPTTTGLAELALDDRFVYFTDSAAGSVLKVPIDGGAIAILAAGRVSPTRLTVDATSVYWLEDAGVVRLTPK